MILQRRDRLRRAHAGHDVFALRIDQELAVKNLLAGRRIARESHTGARLVAGVAKDHRLDVDGGAPLGRDVVFPAVNDRAIVHPRTEHGANSAIELLPGIGGKFFSGAVSDKLLETDHEFLEIVGGQFGIVDVRVIALMLEVVDHDFERFVIFVGPLLHAHHDVAVHLDKAPIAIPGESFVLCGCGERKNRVVVEAQIEDRIHHAGHGVARARPHGNQQRHLLLVAERRAHDLFDLGDAVLDHALQFFRVRLLVGVVIGADFGRDRETGRNGQTDAAHFGEVCAFAAEQGFMEPSPSALPFPKI